MLWFLLDTVQRMIAMRLCHLVLASYAFASSSIAGAQIVPLEHAHAHNDYEHTRPLFEALEHGFSSVEADVYLVNGRLLVAHSRDSVNATRTLESLYLDPLRAYVKEHGGKAYPGPMPLTLLIDVKSNADSVYVVLDAVLRRYPELFTSYAGTAIVEHPIVAVISGNRAIGTMRNASSRFAGIDGRLVDLDSAASASLMPLISDSWERITKWNGSGPPPAALQTEVRRIVARAHQRGQRVRFWATPDTPVVWQFLLDANVDLIGADDLDGLRAFLLRRVR